MLADYKKSQRTIENVRALQEMLADYKKSRHTIENVDAL